MLLTPSHLIELRLKILKSITYMSTLNGFTFDYFFFSKVPLHVSLEMSVPCLSINSQKWPLKTSQKLLIVNQMINRDQEVRVRQWATQLLTARG